jgi:hypothetical protein
VGNSTAPARYLRLFEGLAHALIFGRRVTKRRPGAGRRSMAARLTFALLGSHPGGRCAARAGDDFKADAERLQAAKA